MVAMFLMKLDSWTFYGDPRYKGATHYEILALALSFQRNPSSLQVVHHGGGDGGWGGGSG